MRDQIRRTNDEQVSEPQESFFDQGAETVHPTNRLPAYAIVSQSVSSGAG